MPQNTVISFPIPAYANVPIQPENFQPSQFVITNLSFGETTTVTMANGLNNVSPNYIIGQLIRLLLPSKYGARQLNEQTGYVLSIISSSQVEVDIYSIGTDPFIPNPTFLPYESKTPPQIVAVGDINTGLICNTGRAFPLRFIPGIPGNFENISP